MEKNCLFSVGTLTAGMFFFLDPNLDGSLTRRSAAEVPWVSSAGKRLLHPLAFHMDKSEEFDA